MKKIFLLVLLLILPSMVWAQGFGPYKFGMTMDEVKKITDCPAYTMSANGQGMWCENYNFEGKKRFLDFYFGQQGLGKIMVTFYEAKGSMDEAVFKQSLADLVLYMEKNFGPLESPSLQEKAVNTESLYAAFKDTLAKAESNEAKVQLKPKTNPTDKFVFASLVYAKAEQHTMISFYFQSPRQ